MQEIVTFLKSLLSRKFLLAVAAFIATNITKIPPKYQYLVPVANFAVVAIYAYANVAEKKVSPALPPSIDADAVAAQAEAIAAGTTTEPSLPADPTTAPDAGAQ
jgi:hypothetical protein